MRHISRNFTPRKSMATLTAWLLVLATLPSAPVEVAHAFMPSDDFAESTGVPHAHTHESITRKAVAALDEKLFERKEDELTANMKEAMETIITFNASTDSYFGEEFLQSAPHFDSEDFQGAQQRLIDFRLRVKELLTDDEPQVEEARQFLGRALHTLQDFYSHSNWVEVGHTFPARELGSPGSPMINPSVDTPTCTECTRNWCNECYDPSAGLNDLTTTRLTTGWYGDDDRSKRYEALTGRKKPPLKCSHGGLVNFLGQHGDSSGSGAIHQGINKDTYNCIISPHFDRHIEAARVALAATTEFLEDIQEDVGTPKMKLLLGGGTTLAISVDTTGSMGSIIESAKQQFISMIDSRLGTDEEPTKYVLAPFNDPDVGPLTVTDDPDDFKNAIRELIAHDGDDCPERALAGTMQAVNEMEDGGELLIYTDASSKEGNLTSALDSLGLSKHIKVNVLSYGSCSPIDPNYIRLANDTGGQVFSLQRSEAGKVSSLADFVVRSNAVEVLHVSSTLAGAPRTFGVPVDSTMTAVTFSVSGVTDVTLTRPDGAEIGPGSAPDSNVRKVALSTGVVYSITAPPPGEWGVRLNGFGNVSVRVSGESLLDLSYFDFVEWTGRPQHEGFFPIHGFPQPGQESKVKAQVTGQAATASFELRGVEGTLLHKPDMAERPLPIWTEGEAAPVKKLIGSVTINATPFRAYVTGLDANGHKYQRVISSIFRPQGVRLVPPRSVALTPGQSTDYKFQVINGGPPGTFRLAGADDDGFLSGITPATLTLAAGETKEVTATLRVPPDAGDLAMDTLTVSVQSSSDASAFNYAVVKSTVRRSNYLLFDSATAQERGGNGNGVVEGGEAGALNVRLLNLTDAELKNVSATLAVNTPGVTLEESASAYPSILPGGFGTNSTPFNFKLADEVLCGQVIKFTMKVTHDDSPSPTVYDFGVQTGRLRDATAAPPNVFSYAGPPVPIPDNNLSGVSIPLKVDGLTTAVSDLRLAFDGNSCTGATGPLNVGLEHTAVGSLVITLTSPQGTTVTLMNRPGGAFNGGDHFCQTVLDSSVNIPIQGIKSFGPAPEGPPYTGTFRPASPLTAFAGENPNGTWLLNVSDRAPFNKGNVKAFSLIISAAECGPPAADLSLSMTAAPDTSLSGANVTYTLTASNRGPGEARDVVVTSALPPGVSSVSCAATGGGVCEGEGASRIVKFPSMAAGASETITLVGSLDCALKDSTRLSHTASINSATPDPEPANNEVTVALLVSNPAPEITAASVSVPELWPPNHKVTEVSVLYTVKDNCGPLINALSVTSNEPVNDAGDGDTAPDWEVLDERRVRLRAERSGAGNGRVYTITITSTDGAGASSNRAVSVFVPKNRK